MKNLLIIALAIVMTGCAKQTNQLETTGFSETVVVEESVKAKPAVKKSVKVSTQVVEKALKEINSPKNKEIINIEPVTTPVAPVTEYQKSLKTSLQEKLEYNKRVFEFKQKLQALKQEFEDKKQLAALEKKTAMESLAATDNAKVEESFTDKFYDFAIKPIRKQILKWNFMVNKEVPKYMKELKNNPSIAVVLFSLFAAFIYGIIHTLGPGHGKMVIATYFLTQEAKFMQGVWLGLQTAFAHVGGAVVLVLVTDLALKGLAADPAQHIYLLKNVSFSLIVLVGTVLLLKAILHVTGTLRSTGCRVCSSHANKKVKKNTWIACAIGCIPCTGSLLILLYAMANQMLGYGILMVVFVALGMALTMIGLGVLAIMGKKKIINKPFAKSKHMHKFNIMLELLGAIFIILIGALLLWVNL